MKANINCCPEYIEYFYCAEDELDSFVFYNAANILCTGFRDLSSGSMIEIRKGHASLESAISYAKSLL